MQPIKPATQCPHCAGKSGYITKIVFRAKRLYSWCGQDVDTEGYMAASETDPRCLDCGRPVRGLFRAQQREGQ